MPQPPSDPIYIIDGHGYIFRAYYAVRQLSTSTGFSTNALFGFCNMLVKVLRERKPNYLAIAFDPGGKNFRHELYPAYKANRSAPPEDLPAQIPLIREAVQKFNIRELHRKGFEADDLIGTLARKLAAEGHAVRIVTGDKDLCQLVDDNIQLVDDMRAMRGGDSIQKPQIDRAEVEKKFGVPPEMVTDVMALAGDSSDNIPGVKGIGVKTAAQLVTEHGDLEAILAAAPGIKQKARRERLIEHADDARMSKKLVTIRDDLELDASLEQLKYDGPNLDEVRAFFEEYELKRLLSDPVIKGDSAHLVQAPRPTSRRAPQGQRPKGQQDFFGAPGLAEEASPIDLDRGTYETITDDKGLEGVRGKLAAAEIIGVRVLIDSEPGQADKLVGLGVSWNESEGAYVPLGHAEELVFPAQLDAKTVAGVLGPVLADQKKAVVVEDGKMALEVLTEAGFPPFDLEGDPTLASYLLDPEANGHDIPAVARRRFEHEALTREDICGKGKGARTMADTDVDKARTLASEHADLSRRLQPILEEALIKAEMDRLYHDVELPLAAVLAKVELNGLLVDTKGLRELATDFEAELDDLEKRAWDAAGESFNLGSPKQVAEMLFERLGLKIVKRTQTGPSTDSSVLEQLKHDHALPGLILEHRVAAKLKNTYIDVLPELVRPSTGRVHTRLNQNVAATGRLSSSEPNLQNIPARTELGRKIRRAFVAPEGRKLISLDYSQIELRLLAHVSGDPVLVEAFETGQDVHQRTAAEIFDVPTQEVTREQRGQAKTINFGLLYGMGVLRLGRELGLKRKEAKAFLDRYFQRLAGIRAWNDDALARAHEDGFVRTILGRRRILPGLQSQNRGEVARAERLAINTPIQGSAADIIKKAMILADQTLQDLPGDPRMLLQVHDELLIEVDEAQTEPVLEAVRSAMLESASMLRVPMVVDANAGGSWAEVH